MTGLDGYTYHSPWPGGTRGAMAVLQAAGLIALPVAGWGAWGLLAAMGRPVHTEAAIRLLTHPLASAGLAAAVAVVHEALHVAAAWALGLRPSARWTRHGPAVATYGVLGPWEITVTNLIPLMVGTLIALMAAARDPAVAWYAWTLNAAASVADIATVLHLLLLPRGARVASGVSERDGVWVRAAK